MMTICDEMKKLRSILDMYGIKWEDASEQFESHTPEFDVWICRTWFEINGILFSAINGFGTYGGYNDMRNIGNKGLLELMYEDEPDGYLSAVEVMEIVKNRVGDLK